MLDRNFICSLLKEKSMNTVHSKKIKKSYLHQDFTNIFEFIQKFSFEFKKVPEISTIEDRFGSFYEEPEENLLHYCDEIIKREKYRKLISLHRDISTLLKDPNLNTVDKGTHLLRKTSSEFLLELGESRIKDINQDSLDRFDVYTKRKERIIEIPSPWVTFNKFSLGWHEGELNVILGLPAMGKTWTLLLCAVEAVKSFKRVIFFSEEMSFEELAFRYDALITGISYSKLASRDLSPEEEETYLNHLSSEFKEGIKFAEGVGSEGIEGIISYIREEEADLALVDGLYLYSEDYDYKSIGKVTKLLKRGASSLGIPIITTSQKSDK